MISSEPPAVADLASRDPLVIYRQKLPKVVISVLYGRKNDGTVTQTFRELNKRGLVRFGAEARIEMSLPLAS